MKRAGLIPCVRSISLNPAPGFSAMAFFLDANILSELRMRPAQASAC
jgi:hypothetical protein